MDNYIEYRVFKSSVHWADVIFYFPLDVTFDEIKTNINSSFLTKNDFVGKYKFHPKYFNIMSNKSIKGKTYYLMYFIPEET